MLNVLVADDDENVRESVAAALVVAGHRVTEARDGAQAARLVASHAFDVAICDLRMPHLDGLTLLRKIRRETPGTAVILMMSYGRLQDVVDSLRDGAVDCIRKPFDPELLTRELVEPLAAHRPHRARVQLRTSSATTFRSAAFPTVAGERALPTKTERPPTRPFADPGFAVPRRSGEDPHARTVVAESRPRTN